MRNKPKVIAIINEKGGTGKTTTCESLGIGLANEGKRVLMIDLDPQASLTAALGYRRSADINQTVSGIMNKIIQGLSIENESGILQQAEGVDLLPSDEELSGVNITLANLKNRGGILKRYVDQVKKDYDYILIDCLASLGMLTINALSAADSTIIPMEAHYLSVIALERELRIVSSVKQQMNPKLKIEGILFTRVDRRTNHAKEMSELIKKTYGTHIRVFKTDIPNSIRAAEMCREGVSIYKHSPGGTVAEAYRSLTKEVLEIGEKERRRRIEQLR